MKPTFRIAAWSLVAALTGAHAFWAFTPIDVRTTAQTSTPVQKAPLHEIAISPPVEGVALGELAQVLDRPIFWSSRRPREAPANTAPDPSDAAPPSARLDGLRLAGVMRNVERKQALIEWSERPEGVWVEEGTIHAGWRIASIDEQEVRLEARGQVIRLRLSEPR